jgi:hypothetical protein
MASRVKASRITLTGIFCRKVYPFVIRVAKQPVSFCVEFENKRRMAWPSKSGMVSASSGIPATSSWLIGIMPAASIGVPAQTGQALIIISNVP